MYVDVIFAHHQNASVVTVTITATDKGEPSLTNTSIITVNVDDVNEFSPMFSKDQYANNEVLDTDTPGQIIVIVTNLNVDQLIA